MQNLDGCFSTSWRKGSSKGGQTPRVLKFETRSFIVAAHSICTMHHTLYRFQSLELALAHLASTNCYLLQLWMHSLFVISNPIYDNTPEFIALLSHGYRCYCQQHP